MTRDGEVLRLLERTDLSTFMSIINASGLKVLGRQPERCGPTESQIRSLGDEMEDGIDPYLLNLKRFVETLGYLVAYD